MLKSLSKWTLAGTLAASLGWAGCQGENPSSSASQEASQPEAVATDTPSKGSSPAAEQVKAQPVENWPQFLGPNRDATVPSAGLARSWPADGPKELWKVDVGSGFGGACIQDGLVYILERPEPNQEVLRCFKLSTGEEVWNKPYETRTVKLPFPGARSTPTYANGMLFTVGPVGLLHAWNPETHESVWSVDLLEAFELGQTARWGFGQSPLVIGDKVIVAPMNDEKGFLAAYEAKTGKLVWKTPEIGGAAYGSPRLYQLAGRSQIIQMGRVDGDKEIGRISSVDPETGAVLWQWDGYYVKFPIPSPTAVPGDRLFVTGGYGADTVMIQVKQEGSLLKAEELWRISAQGSQLHPAVLHDGHLYANWNQNDNLKKGKYQEGGLACLDLDGKVLWRTGEDPNFNRGNLLYADGLVLILEGETGELMLVDPNPDGYRELARAKVFTDLPSRDSKIWAPMALSNGKVIVRSQKELKCFDLSASQGAE